MLELLNNYAHGFVAVPVIRSCERHGLLAALDVHEPRPFDDVCAQLGANPGHLKVALVLLESIGWIAADAEDRLIKTAKAELAQRLPAGVEDLLTFSFDAYIDGQVAPGGLTRWYRASARRWEIGDEVLAQFLDGMVAIPLLLALHERNLLAADESGGPRLLTAGLPHGDEIVGFLREKGWLEERAASLVFTPCGRFVADRIYITATVASYRPMLARISEVIFGDCRAVFARDSDGAERHVDRRLNVKGSGFQHEKYFSDLEDTIVAIFDHPNFHEQPKYVADMGCGDGTLLKRIYEVIRDKTARGRVLASHPIKLLGCDINDQALHETSLTLQGLDHWVMKADIGDPGRLIADLRARGIADPEAILHVRSFLDHDRPYIAPRDRLAAAARERTAGKSVHVDRDGKAISAGAVVQSLVEHLQRWSAAVGRYGLAVLEVHCLSAETIFKYLDKCESLHFDAYHRFSHQFLVTADQFILAAAEAGLFPSPVGSRRYPKVFPFTRITLNHFRQRPYRVRHAQRDDLTVLAQLEGGWTLSHPRSSAAEIARRLVEYPEGQIVLESRGQVVGAAYTQRLFTSGGDTAEGQGAPSLRWRHAAAGNTVELLYATVAPAVEEGWVREWGEFVEGWSRAMPGCELFSGRGRVLRQQERAMAAMPSLPPALASTIRRVVLDAQGLRDTQAPEGELEAFGVEMLLSALQAIGLPNLLASGPVIRSHVAARLGVLPRYERLLQALLRMLERRGRLHGDGDRVSGVDRPSFPGGDMQRAMREFEAQFRQTHPDFQPFLKLMLRCVEFYGDVLTGKKEANDVVFPGGEVDLFAGIFKGNAAADYFNGLVAEIVAAKVEQCAGQRCNILEVGAGTGGTTGPVLSRLDRFGDHISFCYTDISSTFTRSGEKRFGAGRPWMSFERLNIEDDLGAQGFEPASFDIIYAANVLHDTRQMKKTLGQVRSLLKPGGLLVLNEYTQMKDLLLLTGGLLHGWWLFEDAENRLDGSCLLSIPLWQSILTACGFHECHGLGLPDEANLSESRQGVIVATQPETVRTERELTGDNLDEVLRAAVHEILGDRRIKAFSPEVPLMECGLDSLELLELRALIGKKLGVELEASFFFQYSTIQKVAAYFRKQRREMEPERAAPAVRPATTVPQPPRISRVDGQNAGVAVVGVALRFPGGIGTMADYWNLLKTGRSAIGPAAANRWSWPAEVDVGGDKAYLTRGGFLERIDEFDASFFRLSPREAELLDPQQRFLLELSWAAMEDAGYRPSLLRGSRTGVYIGACHFDYRSLLEGPGGPVNALLSTGTAGSLLANRISYLHDFQGPSILFDTACSSSLVALAEAVQAVRSGRCTQALVGGVNLICSTTNTLAYDHAQMLSREGDCYPFDARAKGYVRGEGGAVLLLKNLDAAVRDRDAIYAVVRGVAVNHGGEASSLTAPNPAAQARVISAALDDAGVRPETIGYVEAHGTGTPLGDPIEIEGLNAALSVGGSLERGCGLGSVKSTLGHLEGAAGLAGFIKVLLCLRHHAIPPSRNFATINPEIRLGRRFFIADRLTEWTPRSDETGAVLPRRGGVSAFGFGGANAHVILEEYSESAAETSERRNVIVPFSAKSPEALRQSVERTAAFLHRAKADGVMPALASIAYTLQVGREPLAHRVAFVAIDVAELLSKLDEFCAGRSALGPWHGQAGDRPPATMADLLAGDAGREFIQRLIRDREHNKLARLWVEGLEVDWEQFYSEAKPARLHLPTYPFARDRFWAPDRSRDPASRAQAPRAEFVSHALLQEDHSKGGESRFAATFSGDEFFFADHQVEGQRVLPGVAHLEMAALAARKIWGEQVESGLRLTDVFWTRPVVIEQSPLTLSLVLTRETKSDAAFEICSGSGHDRTTYSQGRLHRVTPDTTPTLDLSQLQAGCQAMPADPFYACFREIGIAYGPGHRAVEMLYIGKDRGLAKLVLPASSASTGRFFLHPSLMDGALQAGVAVLLGFGQESGSGDRTPLLPFALETLDILAGCSQTMWAVVQIDRRSATARFDLDLCDGRGRICVRFRGVQTRPLPGERVSKDVGSQTAVGAVSLFCPVWEPIKVNRSSSPATARRIALIGGTDQLRAELQRWYPMSEILPIAAHDSIDAIAAALERQGKVEHLLWAASEPMPQSCADDAVISAQASGVRLCFRLVKALHRLGYEQRDLQWTLLTFRTQRVLASDKVEPVHASLHGFVGSMAKEYPRWKVRAIDLENGDSLPAGDWVSALSETSGETLAWRSGQWHRQELIPTDFSSTRGALPYRRGGVYVAIGGAGGIGAVWSEWMVRKWDAQIVWIGRSPLDAAIRAKIEAVGKWGAAPLYISADATDRASLTRAYTEITTRFSKVHGVVHSALVLLDQSLARMDEARFVAALSAKVDVSVRIAQVFRDASLDFALFFSSIAAFSKAAGQSNYAAGCVFKDSFAARLAQEWACPVKVLNWGYWGSVGRVATDEYRDMMAAAGIGSIEPEEGMAALDELLAAPLPQLAAIKLIERRDAEPSEEPAELATV